MYRIDIDEHLVYNSSIDTKTYSLLKADLSLEMNAAGSLTLQFPSTHPYKDEVNFFTSTVTVYKDEQWYWSGRCVTGKQVDFFNQVSYTFEGVLSFLNDTIQPSAKYESYTIRQFISDMLDIHNSKVSDNRKIYVDNIEIDDGLNDRYTEYETTLKCIQDIIEDNGGIITFQYFPEGSVWENPGYYMSITTEPYEYGLEQYINFGKNLLDFTKNCTMEDFASVIIPLGGEDPDTHETVTIAPENDGKIYLANTTLVNEMGWVEKVVTNTDYTTSSELYQWATHIPYLELNDNASIEFNVSAIDMSLLDSTIEEFKIGAKIRVVSAPHNLDEALMICKLDKNLLDPSQDKISIGQKVEKGISTMIKK